MGFLRHLLAIAAVDLGMGLHVAEVAERLAARRTHKRLLACGTI